MSDMEDRMLVIDEEQFNERLLIERAAIAIEARRITDEQAQPREEDY